MEFIFDNILPLAVLAVIGTLFLIVLTMLRNTHVTPPNLVAVISGSKRAIGEAGAKVGYRIVTGGRFFLMPVLEKVDFLSLNLMTFPVEVHSVPSASGAPVSVKAVANVKILSTMEMLGLAVERFLGKTPEEIKQIAKENLESNLRSIVGKMQIEELMMARDKLQQQVMHEAVTDLGKMGLGIDLLNIQDVQDTGGYIKALGESRTAEVKRDAAIGSAEALRQQTERTQAARALGESAKLQADLAVSNQTKETQLAIAENDALVQSAQAKVPLIAATVAAGEQAKLNVATVGAEQERVKAATQLQLLEKTRKERELEATTIVIAQKTAEANVITAEGQAKAAERLGDAEKIKVTKAAEGRLAETQAEAEGRVATAVAGQKEAEALALGTKAAMLADADGRRAALLAEAAGIEAKGLAEAKGIEAKAQALKELNDAGRFLMILEASPKAIDAIGHAMAGVMTPVAGAIGQGLQSIDKVTLTQLGPGGSGQGSVVQEFATLPVETIATIIEKARALGFGDIATQIMKSSGVDVDAILKKE